jgi:hypothetical protein
MAARDRALHRRCSRAAYDRLGDYVMIWDVTLDARSADEIVALVKQRSPWKLQEGRLALRWGPPVSPSNCSHSCSWQRRP